MGSERERDSKSPTKSKPELSPRDQEKLWEKWKYDLETHSLFRTNFVGQESRANEQRRIGKQPKSNRTTEERSALTHPHKQAIMSTFYQAAKFSQRSKQLAKL